MITMKSLKHGAIALLLVAAFITMGVYEAAAELVLFGTTGRSGCLSRLVEIDPSTGEITRDTGPVGFAVNGLAWDPTTDRLYASSREGGQGDARFVTDGNHDGVNNTTILVDSSENFIALGVTVGLQILNDTDDSWGTITAVSATTITATLTGGSENLWDNGDSYTVVDPAFNGLIEIDPRTGAGTQIGVQGWGLAPSAPVTNITVNSLGQMYGWAETSDDLVLINKSTGVATVVGNSGVSTNQHGLAFDNTDTLYLVNRNGDYYIINTSTGIATLQGDIFPSSSEDAHHGVFHPSANKIYYGLTTFWDGPMELVRADLSTGTVLSRVPICCDCVHTLAFFEDTSCIMDVDLDFDDLNNELMMGFSVRTAVPGRLIIKLIVLNQAYNLAGIDLPAFDPRVNKDVSMPCPNIGKVGVLATVLTQTEGISCSAWETVDTGN